MVDSLGSEPNQRNVPGDDTAWPGFLLRLLSDRHQRRPGVLYHSVQPPLHQRPAPRWDLHQEDPQGTLLDGAFITSRVLGRYRLRHILV